MKSRIIPSICLPLNPIGPDGVEVPDVDAGVVGVDARPWRVARLDKIAEEEGPPRPPPLPPRIEP